MPSVVESLKKVPIVSYSKGEAILTQGKKTNKLFFLFDGNIEIIRDGIQVSTISDKGSVFGEIAILLDIPHTATVRCLQNSTFYMVEQPEVFIQQHKEVLLYISQITASRLFNLTEYIVKKLPLNSDENNTGIVGDVVETLLHQQQTTVLERGKGEGS